MTKYIATFNPDLAVSELTILGKNVQVKTKDYWLVTTITIKTDKESYSGTTINFSCLTFAILSLFLIVIVIFQWRLHVRASEYYEADIEQLEKLYEKMLSNRWKSLDD